MEKEPSPYIRILENGIKILAEDITEDENTIVFEFHLDRNATKNELRELWTPSPNCVIFDRLVKKGWTAKDGTIFIHFGLDLFQDKKNKTTRFEYYKKADSAQKKGLEWVN